MELRPRERPKRKKQDQRDGVCVTSIGTGLRRAFSPETQKKKTTRKGFHHSVTETPVEEVLY